jgi:hypothetical protein
VPSSRVLILKVVNDVPIFVRELGKVHSPSVGWITAPVLLTVATGGDTLHTCVAPISPLSKFFGL